MTWFWDKKLRTKKEMQDGFKSVWTWCLISCIAMLAGMAISNIFMEVAFAAFGLMHFVLAIDIKQQYRARFMRGMK